MDGASKWGIFSPSAQLVAPSPVSVSSAVSTSAAVQQQQQQQQLQQQQQQQQQQLMAATAAAAGVEAPAENMQMEEEILETRTRLRR